MNSTITSRDILDALIARSDDVIWATELQLFSGVRRIDFWTLMPSKANRYRATAYEIKISRSDFMRDDEDKQKGALSWSDYFWYVTPPGLLTKEEVPKWAGLQEWNGERFRILRKPPIHPKTEPTWELVCSILRNAGDIRRDVGLMKAQLAFYQTNAEARDRRKKLRQNMQFQTIVRRLNARASTSNTISDKASVE